MKTIIEEIKHDMQDWFSFELSAKQIREYLRENKIEFLDTVERDCMADWLSQRITGMNWPCVGDTKEHKEKFLKLMEKNSEIKGYVWKK